MIDIFNRLRLRLRARDDSEHEQALLRIVIVAVVLAYMAATYSASRPSFSIGHTELLLVEGLTAALILAIGIFAAICAWPRSNIPRRALGMLADAGAATFCMFLAAESGVSMIGVYLFITFGNGFRYGRAYLFACQALCLIGFEWVLLYAPYWQAHSTSGWSLMVALIVLPIYVSTLLKRIHEARTKAEEANRAKSSFLANMSHEMRTPLNGIVGVADLLQVTAMNPQQTELMRLLRHSVALLRSLVDDVLDISKIEAGRVAIEVADFDLHATLNGLVALLRPHARAKGLALNAVIDPTIEYNLRGDSHHLRQVLLNLLSNAIKFTESGSINIAVKQVFELDSRLKLRFEVRDTGIGITQSAQQKIFDRFVQADDSTTRRYGGTGLGTTIAKQLVELMGGVIGVDSEEGKGSSFWFEIPLVKSAHEPRVGTLHPAAETPTFAILVEARPLESARRLVQAACDKMETVPLSAFSEKLPLLPNTGSSVRAVIVAGTIDETRFILTNLSNSPFDSAVALIYLDTSKEPVELELPENVSAIRLDAAPRVLRNAIHAATTRTPNEGAEIIDLGKVLSQQRQPLRILVAEDNVTNQTIVCKLLESAGHTVWLASDGEEALDIYEDKMPELALLDFNMPQRNGVEVCTAIRMMEASGAHLPIIILSASVTVECRERARVAGADEFVGKPFEAANLLQVIDRLARRSNRGMQTRNRAVTVQPVAAVSLVDQARIQDVERITRDASFMSQLVGGFRGDLEMLLGRLDAVLASGRLGAVSEITHAIKGASLGVGAQQLAARCAGIDDAAANGQLSQVRSLARELRRCFDATAVQLTAYSQRKGASV